jgi:hypothetical protein
MAVITAFGPVDKMQKIPVRSRGLFAGRSVERKADRTLCRISRVSVFYNTAIAKGRWPLCKNRKATSGSVKRSILIAICGAQHGQGGDMLKTNTRAIVYCASFLLAVVVIMVHWIVATGF